MGLNHAFYSVSTPTATVFRRQCYGPAPKSSSSSLRTLYENFEQRRKGISFEYYKDPDRERIELHTLAKQYHSAFLDAQYHYDAYQNDNKKNRTKEIIQEEDNSHYLSSRHKKHSKSTMNTIYAQTNIPLDYDSPKKLSFATFSHNATTTTATTTEAPLASSSIQEWTWSAPALFSEKGTRNTLHFRKKMYLSMRNQPSFLQRLHQAWPSFTQWKYGRQSGMFWYPPGAVREWHNNKYDLGYEKELIKGATSRDLNIMKSQVWRMYFVRTVRDENLDAKLLLHNRKNSSSRSWDGTKNNSNNDCSGMHIIPGEDAGLTLEVLRRAGARPLKKHEKQRQWSDEFAEAYDTYHHFNSEEESTSNDTETKRSDDDDDDEEEENNLDSFDRNSVWRIPDHDGYVTFFRLPDIWHCIVSEEVHRYSLGFAFSEEEVQALLKLAGVDFDVEVASSLGHDDTRQDETKDEL